MQTIVPTCSDINSRSSLLRQLDLQINQEKQAAVDKVVETFKKNEKLLKQRIETLECIQRLKEDTIQTKSRLIQRKKNNHKKIVSCLVAKCQAKDKVFANQTAKLTKDMEEAQVTCTARFEEEIAGLEEKLRKANKRSKSFKSQLQNTVRMLEQMSTSDDESVAEPDNERLQIVRKAYFECSNCDLSNQVVDRVLFFPCGHGSCTDCARVLNNCHICREKIRQKTGQFVDE